MERIRESLTKLPAGIFTIITLVAILWLTLSPKPLGEQPPALFPGADKIAHGIMFGGFVAMMLLDWQRKHDWRNVALIFAVMCASGASLLGILIEFAQAAMHLGRGFEYADMIADTAGAFAVAFLWLMLQKNWIN